MITKVQIYGERCSGTNYLEQLLLKNFSVQVTWEFGWKHFFNLATLEAGKQKQDISKVLFLCIVRNCKDYLNSLHRQPHHIPYELTSGSVREFLTKPFYSVDINKINDETKEVEIMEDRHIYSGERYRNIFEMRYTKYKFLLDVLPHKVENYLFIRYEDLLEDFDREMKRLHKAGLSIRINICFPQNVEYYKSDPHTLFSSVAKAHHTIDDADIENCQDITFRDFELKIYCVKK